MPQLKDHGVTGRKACLPLHWLLRGAHHKENSESQRGDVQILCFTKSENKCDIFQKAFNKSQLKIDKHMKRCLTSCH